MVTSFTHVHMLCYLQRVDNIQELDKNKDWTMLLAPTFLGEKIYQGGKTWLIFPDLKVCISYVREGNFRVPIKLHLLTIPCFSFEGV